MEIIEIYDKLHVLHSSGILTGVVVSKAISKGKSLELIIIVHTTSYFACCMNASDHITINS